MIRLFWIERKVLKVPKILALNPLNVGPLRDVLKGGV